ncbi:MAG: hypothetical protein JEZ11_10450 [Desulfobacterales bacterium]|nr:hypothetical protein [Desulfobacterales bacterium]
MTEAPCPPHPLTTPERIPAACAASAAPQLDTESPAGVRPVRTAVAGCMPVSQRPICQLQIVTAPVI